MTPPQSSTPNSTTGSSIGNSVSNSTIPSPAPSPAAPGVETPSKSLAAPPVIEQMRVNSTANHQPPSQQQQQQPQQITNNSIYQNGPLNNLSTLNGALPKVGLKLFSGLNFASGNCRMSK